MCLFVVRVCSCCLGCVSVSYVVCCLYVFSLGLCIVCVSGLVFCFCGHCARRVHVFVTVASGWLCLFVTCCLYVLFFLLGLSVFSFDCRLSLLVLVGCLFVVCVLFKLLFRVCVFDGLLCFLVV